MTKKTIFFAILFCGSILVGCAMVGPIMSDVEKPKYQATALTNEIELRSYDPMLVAMVQMSGSRKDAISEGFRVLADYIFGNNTLEQNISMTAPVEQQAGQKISMTAPVQQQQRSNSWMISFVMPKQFTLKTIPKPNNEMVKINEVPAQRFITIRFSGSNSDDNIRKNESALFNYITQNKINVTGEPKYAFYNPPWTLPFMRRNEIMVQLLDD
jgi:effector-binding domain-containing protein|tara:strand:+ start:978 stop:1616 length:639 start_codon:yes stop_codon:yes gene_type:complete